MSADTVPDWAPVLAEAIACAREHGLPLEIHYHPDADPGDGAGWAVMLGDVTEYGDPGAALARLLAGREVEIVPAGEVERLRALLCRWVHLCVCVHREHSLIAESRVALGLAEPDR